MTFSYLEFLDNPTPDNIKAVHAASGLIQPQAAELAGIGLQTYRGWCSSIDSVNFRKPHDTTWNLFLYQLESQRLGYENLFDFFSQNS